MISCGFFPHNMTVLQAEQEVAVDGIQADGNRSGFDPDPVVLCIRAWRIPRCKDSHHAVFGNQAT